MDNHAAALTSKVWSFCNTLLDDGVSYGDYIEQITYLLFLKMVDEYSKPPHNKMFSVPDDYNWDSLSNGTALKQGLLKQVFEGKLLSTEELSETRQAPDWEPAEKLLERIESHSRAQK